MTYDEALDWLRRNPGKLLCAPFDYFGERYRIDPENSQRIQAGFFQHICECEKCGHVTRSGFDWMRTIEPHERLGDLVPLEPSKSTEWTSTFHPLGAGIGRATWSTGDEAQYQSGAFTITETDGAGEQ